MTSSTELTQRFASLGGARHGAAPWRYPDSAPGASWQRWLAGFGTPGWLETPYYIVAMLLIIFFVYLLGLFPLGGGYSVGGQAAFSWRFILDVLKHAFLPALSLVILGAAVNHQTMRLLVQNVKEDDYVRYAKLGNVKEGTIFTRYVMRNASLPQITALAMSFGLVFDGALITEIVFSYPGMGYLLFRSLSFSDYNMIMGITSFSIIGIATGILIIDLLYPLLDPRIRLR